MEKRYNKITMNRVTGDSLDFDDCEEMFQEGYSDNEISNELGINEDYVRKLREEFQRDY
jgi:hypothetical protein